MRDVPLGRARKLLVDRHHDDLIVWARYEWTPVFANVKWGELATDLRRLPTAAPVIRGAAVMLHGVVKKPPTAGGYGYVGGAGGIAFDARFRKRGSHEMWPGMPVTYTLSMQPFFQCRAEDVTPQIGRGACPAARPTRQRPSRVLADTFCPGCMRCRGKTMVNARWCRSCGTLVPDPEALEVPQTAENVGAGFLEGVASHASCIKCAHQSWVALVHEKEQLASDIRDRTGRGVSDRVSFKGTRRGRKRRK